MEAQYMRHLRVIQEPNPAWKPPAGITGPASQDDLCRAFKPYLDSTPQEQNIIVSMDADCHVIGYCPIGLGHSNMVSNRTTEILRFLLLSGATQYVMLHYHPHNGSAAASSADVKFFRELKTAGGIHGLLMADFIILSLAEGFFSFHQWGLFQPGAMIQCRDGLVTV